MWLFLCSEIMLFGAFFSSYIVLRLGSPNFGAPPPEVLGRGLASVNTLILLASSFTAARAAKAFHRGNVPAYGAGMGATSALGLLFLAIKAFEYGHKIAKGVTLTSTLYGSFYFTLTGLHALHLLAGVALNFTLAWAAARGRLSGERALRADYGVLYWHFVDGVWLALFALLYWF
jgi:heme/copper-type cytochrome/quinol oxidase subunit 3